MNDKEIANYNRNDFEASDLEELEKIFSEKIEEDLSDLQFLETERANIADPDKLGEMIKEVIVDQFQSQIGIKNSEEFIEENASQTLDLRKDSHIQTTKNFEKGKIARHNTEINYQERYNKYQTNFKKDKHGDNIYRTDHRTGKQKAVLTEEARKDFDKGRKIGTKAVNLDHIVSTAEVNRDAGMQAHVERDEQVKYVNSEINTQMLSSPANQSKGDSPTPVWLESERYGEKPSQRFYDVNDEEQLDRNEKSRKGYKDIKDKGESKSIQTGKKSRKEEAFKISGKALKSAVMLLLTELINEIIEKLITWFKSTEKSLSSLIEKIKAAFKNFINNLKTNILNASKSVTSTIISSIIGPIANTLRKVMLILKQGWKSLKDAIAYLKDPESKNLPASRLILEVGKIVIAGVSATGSIVLSEAIETSLMTVPIFAIEIPLVGSLANIIGILSGAIVSGIIGAIAINMINKMIAKGQEEETSKEIIEKKNDVMNTQLTHQIVATDIVVDKRTHMRDSFKENRMFADKYMKEVLEDVYKPNNEIEKEEITITENEITLSKLQADLEDLL